MGNMFKGSLGDHMKAQMKAMADPTEPFHKKFKTTTRNAKGMMSGSTWLKKVDRKNEADFAAGVARADAMYSNGPAGVAGDATQKSRRRSVSLIAPRSGVELESI